MSSSDAAAPAGASDNPPSRKQKAPSDRMSRRRRETEAHAGVADDYEAAAFPQADVDEVAPSEADEQPAVAGAEWTPPVNDLEWRDAALEVEAEKVWTLAGVLRAANTAWGIDEGIDADVREARALMAEARRQVREDAPIGEHYRADDARRSS